LNAVALLSWQEFPNSIFGQASSKQKQERKKASQAQIWQWPRGERSAGKSEGNLWAHYSPRRSQTSDSSLSARKLANAKWDEAEGGGGNLWSVWATTARAAIVMSKCG